MTVVQRDGPCVIARSERGAYSFACLDCGAIKACSTRRDAEDLFDRHTHQEAE